MEKKRNNNLYARRLNALGDLFREADGEYSGRKFDL
jgi:hypothetical protein